MNPPPFQTPQDMFNPDDAMEDQTQQATQSTQHSSQANGDENSHLWGFLQPCGSQLKRIDFFKIQPTVSIGRHPEQNEIILPGAKVSEYLFLTRHFRTFGTRSPRMIDASCLFLVGNRHCRIVWDGKEDDKSAVIVADYSSNGTWINGVRIGKDKTAIVKDGNEIAFGSPLPQPGSLEDYRFIYRHRAGGPPKKGVHAFYDISHELGKGSFATVMKAISRATGQWFAIKMIQESKIRRQPDNKTKDGEKDEKEKETSLVREISILEGLDHPNICKLKEVFRDGDNIDLVLEFVDGGDLLDFILQQNGLHEGMAVHITRQICDALSYIHAKGIAHRDLKPENVLLTSDFPPVVKVADFGLAKVVDSLTFLKTMCGTPSYLAPEVVLQTDQGYSHLVDSWSVGVIVFSMLTSSSPFVEDDTQRDIKVRIAERTIEWDTLDQANVSDLAKDFIRQLLEYDPGRRMSLTAARRHPWLNQGLPKAGNPREVRAADSIASLGPDDSSLTSLPDDNDDAMLADSEPNSDPAMNAGLENLDLNQQSRRVMNGRAPLQRRSLVLAAAAHSNTELPEPSWQMLNAASAIPARAGKRKLPENEGLSAVIEDDAENAPVADGGNAANGPRKKGKAASDVESSPGQGGPPAAPARRGGRVGRVRGRAGAQAKGRLHEAAAGMAVEEEHMSEDEAPRPGPRRSARHSPSKAGRRG
ncbi:kinase-like domain-containing protein [Phlebopus sp. FC_14]|nr:kinase-like domain-containing protein [Phlebopus sp. FC_14]